MFGCFGEGGGFCGGTAQKSDFVVEEGGEWKVGIFKGGFEEAELGYHELLVGGRDGEEMCDFVGEIGEGGGRGERDAERFGVVIECESD